MKELCLICWMVISLVLVVSIIGLLLFIPKDTWQNYPNDRSTWCKIGKDLLDSITEK